MPASRPSTPTPLHRFKTWQLFAMCVIVWGTTWHAITYQLIDFPAELAVAMRYGVASLCLLAFCAARRERLRYRLADHAALALQGVFMYGVSYVCVYQAERFVPSGLVAVGYSASPLVTGIGAAMLFSAPLGRRFIVGGLLGLGGVALIFWPELSRPSTSDRPALGAAFTVASVLLSAIGSLVASRNRSRAIALLPAMAWGMFYGAVSALVVALMLRPAIRVAAGRELVGGPGLSRACRLGADLRLLSHAARPRWRRPGRHRGRDDAAAGARGLAAARRLSARVADCRRRPAGGGGQRPDAAAGPACGQP